MNGRNVKWQRRVLGLAWVAVLAGLAGCGPGGPKTYPVSGKVVFKGKGEPAAALQGSFIRLEQVADPKITAVAEIEDEASFILGSTIDGRPYPGLPDGTYRVRITPTVVRGRQVIPQRYDDFRTSKLEITVQPTANDLTVEVDRASR
jgi:hypothetical protein